MRKNIKIKSHRIGYYSYKPGEEILLSSSCGRSITLPKVQEEGITGFKVYLSGGRVLNLKLDTSK